MTDTMPLWTPSEAFKASAPMTDFITWCGKCRDKTFDDYDDFYDWSISERGPFWSAVWDYCDVRGDKGGIDLVDGDVMLKARFFPEARLNFAENLLAKAGDGDALIFRGEDKVSERWSWQRLTATVSRLQQALRDLGISEGDRVAAMMPNMPETIALMLAAASIGAIWSSCSPDFGELGVLDRFGQIEPKLFIACDGYWYNGKRQDVADKVRAVSEKLAVPVLIRRCTGAGGIPCRWPHIRSVHRALCGQGHRLCAAAICASALYPFFLGNHWRAQMHRAFRRWHAAAAPEGAALSLRAFGRRQAVLFHHLRLDDVELAGFRPRQRRDALPL